MQKMPLSSDVVGKLKSIVGPTGFIDNPNDLAPFIEDWRNKFKGSSGLLLKPSSVDQVSAILRVCYETGTPVVPQGGNTGMVGGQIPLQNEVVLSLALMNKIRNFDERNASMIVEAGVILEIAQQAADDKGFILPLSMASKGSCTIGGMISTNAGGVNVIRYGMAREQVLGLEVVLANGKVLNVLRSLRKNNTGYDLKQMFVGAEGTLGIVTAAALKLYPKPPERSTAMLAVPDLNAALSLLVRLQKATGSMLDAFEVFPRAGLELVLKHMPGTSDPFSAPSPWYVLCEFSGAVGTQNVAENVLGDALSDEAATDAVIASSEAQRSALWKLRETLSDSEKCEGPSLKHDVSVPVSSVPEFVPLAIAKVAEIAPELRVVPYGHLGDGNVHFNIISATREYAAHVPERSEEVAKVVYDVVSQFGGSFSAEHGVGAMKVGEMTRYRSTEEIAAMRSLKAAFDPNNILNPGKLLPEA